MLRKLSSQTIAKRFQPQNHGQVQQTLTQQPKVKMPQIQFDENELLVRNKRAIERSSKTTNLLSFTLSKYARFVLTYTQTNGGWQAQLQLPSWLSTSVYEFISAPAIAGWAYSYRVYNIIHDDSEIIRKIKCGDLIGVRQLFSNRDASPFDRSARGMSLLYVCTACLPLRGQ